MTVTSGVVSFPFGMPCHIRPNTKIATIASAQCISMGYCPLYTQKDIQVESHKQNKEPPSTLRMARNAVDWAISKNITELWIACAKPHEWRCHRDLQRAVEEKKAQINIHICESMNYSDENYDWFCPISSIRRVRFPWNWYPREIILRLMPFNLYKKIAS